MHIIGNKLAFILQFESIKKQDPAYGEELRAKLEKHINKKRLGGLLNGNYTLNTSELLICSRVLEMPMEEILLIKEDEPSAA